MKKRIIGLVLIFSLVLASVNLLNGCGTTGDAVTYVSLSINPSLEFIVDDNNVVEAVNAINDDGNLIFSYEDFDGQKIDVVIEKVVELASQSGFLNVEVTDNIVYLSVVDEDSDRANDLFDSIKNKVDTYCKRNGIYALTAKGVVSDELAALANEYNVSAGHLRLMLKAMELDPDLTIEYLVQLNIRELVALTKDNFRNFGQICKTQYKDQLKAERQTLKNQFDADVKTLFGQAYVDLRAELDLLESQLDSVEGAALESLIASIEAKKDEVIALKDQLQETYSAEYEALKTQYAADVQALVESYKTTCQAEREILKQNMQARIDQYKNKWELRRQFAKELNNNFNRDYEEWQEFMESDLFNFIKGKIEELQTQYDEQENDLSYAIAEAEKYKDFYD